MVGLVSRALLDVGVDVGPEALGLVHYVESEVKRLNLKTAERDRVGADHASGPEDLMDLGNGEEPRTGAVRSNSPEVLSPPSLPR